MEKETKPQPSKLSRREFLRGSAAGAVTTGLLTGGVLGAARQVAAEDNVLAGGAQVLGPGQAVYQLQINGKAVAVALEPRVTLLDALRDHLGLTGAKKVCDRATCGACTVLLDGRPVYSCTKLAIEAQGAQILTIEGLGTPENLHPIQAAFVDNDAQQCGFCTPGFVMACKAFLDRTPNPSAEAITTGLGGNLCRCGTYAGIRKAVMQVADSSNGGRSDG